jgi:hypothetical protein
MTECPAELELLALFSAAVLEHMEAVDTLCDRVAMGSKDEFTEASLRAELTASKCKAAHLALEKHRLEHNCRVGSPPARNSSPDHHAQ